MSHGRNVHGPNLTIKDISLIRPSSLSVSIFELLCIVGLWSPRIGRSFTRFVPPELALHPLHSIKVADHLRRSHIL